MNSESSISYYVISEEEIEKIIRTAAETASKEAIAVFEESKKKESKLRVDKRFRNTELLLQNYRMFKISADKSVFSRSQMSECAADILESMMNLYDDEIIIESIKRSATRTAILVTHVDNMVEIYKAYCMNKKDHIAKRRYETLCAAFIDETEKSVEEIAKMFYVSKDTVYEDLRESKKQLASLIFGVDGIKWG